MSSSAASMWQSQVFKRISRKLRLGSQMHEETQLMKLKADRLRDFRRMFLNERFD